jgi:C-terminal processing protease CtpA/Prc
MSLVLVALVCLAGSALAGPKANPDIKGWEPGSDYNKLYDPKEADTLKGRVTKIYTVVPLPGMAPGLALQVEDKKDKGLEVVHLGPKDFVDLASIGLREGDQVKVVGAWTEMDGQDIMIAVKVKKDETVQLKVRRTKDGFPFWGLSPEERAKEISGD